GLGGAKFPVEREPFRRNDDRCLVSWHGNGCLAERPQLALVLDLYGHDLRLGVQPAADISDDRILAYPPSGWASCVAVCLRPGRGEYRGHPEHRRLDPEQTLYCRCR